MIRNKSIGIFDSGFGGVFIMKGIVEKLPKYDFVYLGDTARVPYGTRSKDVVYKFTKEAVDFLFNNNCELIIFACNTASSDALRRIQKEYLPKKYPGKRVLGVIIPAVESALEMVAAKKVGVIATEGTVDSKSFIREFQKINPKIKIFQQACPLLSHIIEAGEQNSEIAYLALKKYLQPLLKKKIDTLILGCTHYGILEPKIRKIVGKNVRIISESRIMGKKLKNYLEKHPEIEKNLGRNSQQIFYSTDLTNRFSFLGKRLILKKYNYNKIDMYFRGIASSIDFLLF